MLNQYLRTLLIGELVESGDLHCSRNAQAVLHRRDADGAGLVADWQCRHHFRIEQHRVIAAARFQGQPDAEGAEQLQRPSAGSDHT